MADIELLPDAEFDVMRVIWAADTPISSVQVHNLSVTEKKWKPQTVLTLLTRLTKRGFLSSEKRGKERYYWPLVTHKEYLQHETGQFVQRFHKNSLSGLMSALFAGRPKDTDLAEIEAWMKEQNERSD